MARNLLLKTKRMNRENIIKHLQVLLKSLVSYYSNIGSFGNHESCHGSNISWYEMFCRSSYGIIAYTKATGDNSYVAHFRKTLLEVIKDSRYLKFNDYDQKAVELPAIALTLFMLREETWDTYDVEQKTTILDYFDNINKIKLDNNNWVFFRILVCSVMQQLSNRNYESIIKEEWQLVDRCYQGDGWYRDGIEGTKDYYNAFGFHFYSLLYCYCFDNKERNSIIKERARLFGSQYKYFFDTMGRSIPYGRSLIYRYAVTAFWSMMLVNGLLNEEEARNAYVTIGRNLEWWLGQPIQTSEGYPSLGYTYPNENMLEAYNSSGSVFWCLKTFLLLLVNKNSKLWTIEIENGNQTSINKLYRVANGDIIISSSETGNIAYINSYHGTGQKQDYAKYMHFAYHSALGFNIDDGKTNFSKLSDDSSLIFNVNGVKIKRECNLVYENRNEIMQFFVWEARKDIVVYSIVLPMVDQYIRLHVIKSKIACDCYETGFAIKSDNGNRTISNNNAIVRNNDYVSHIKCLVGNGVPELVSNSFNSNIYHPETVMPVVKYSIIKGNNVIADITGLNAPDTSQLITIADDCLRLLTPEGSQIIPFKVDKSIKMKVAKMKLKEQFKNVKNIAKTPIKVLMGRN